MSVQGNFPFYKSKLDLRQETYTNNRKEWQKVLRTFEENLKVTSSEGNTVSTQRHQDREQLLGEPAPMRCQRRVSNIRRKPETESPCS